MPFLRCDADGDQGGYGEVPVLRQFHDAVTARGVPARGSECRLSEWNACAQRGGDGICRTADHVTDLQFAMIVEYYRVLKNEKQFKKRGTS